MELIINGERRNLTEGVTLSGLLQELQVNQQLVAVEVNAELVPRESHDQHQLQPGDRVEIVTLVGGG